MKNWSPISWLNYTYEQAVHYHNLELIPVIKKLSTLPPLVSSGEINKLKLELIKVQKGEAFILQGGDCAESFADCQSEIISNKLKILLQMSLVLIYGIQKPVIRIGRIAGQYAKPRSNDFETQNGKTLPSYRGDMINSSEFNDNARKPQPELLLKSYKHAAVTLNFIRALLAGGFADLENPEFWDLSAQNNIKNLIINSTNFLQSIEGLKNTSLKSVDFYTSHEALHLYYEQALTRKLSDTNWYNLSTHLPWIGMRTAKHNSAHLEFLRGVENPIGIKLGSEVNSNWLLQMLNILNPDKEDGKILLITRFGKDNIQKILPDLINTVQKHNLPVIWICDPMHGNTKTTKNGFKTRHFDTILEELVSALNIHNKMGSFLGGVHFELSGENVTECLGGASNIKEEDLSKSYHSLLDPRLNYEQSLEMALKFSDKLKHTQKHSKLQERET